MKIEESLLAKTISRNISDPYYASLEFMRQMSGRGKVVEKENSYATDGPFHRSEVVFDLVQHLDRHTETKISFSLLGENSRRNFFRADIAASFISRIEERGIFTELFAQFYLENVFPVMRKTALERAQCILDLSENIIEKIPSSHPP